METSIFRIRGFHSLWQAFPSLSTIYMFYHSTGHPHAALQPRLKRFGLFRFRSPLLSESPEDRSSSWFLFLELLRWFSSLSVALQDYFIHLRSNGSTSIGLPHSVIQGSQNMCFSPWLFAAYHDLLRLVAPRHPPYTYIRLTILCFLLIQSFNFSSHYLVLSHKIVNLRLFVFKTFLS